MEKIYKCVEDLYGDDFLVGEIKSLTDWKIWALKDRLEADNLETYNRIAKLYGKHLISFIELTYSIKLEEVK